MNDSGIIKPDDLALTVPDKSPSSPGKSLNLADIEKKALQKAMNLTEGNLSKAARLLNISRTTLYSKLQKHDL
jgi:transcriptional regulator of acetoin/glycerol metabolism